MRASICTRERPRSARASSRAPGRPRLRSAPAGRRQRRGARTRHRGRRAQAGRRREHAARCTTWSSARSARAIRGCCWAWPPDWYKSIAYRSRAVREPRAVLAEFGESASRDVPSASTTARPTCATSSCPSAPTAPSLGARPNAPPWWAGTR